MNVAADTATSPAIELSGLRFGYGSQADVIASVLGIDMTKWWRPTRVTYFDHVTKERIVGAVTEGVSKQAADNIAAMKKGPMAARAEDLLADKGWLPEALRKTEAAGVSVIAEA